MMHPDQLKTETNTPQMERRVLKSARMARLARRSHRLSADFEHGQWWVTNLQTGAQWSVHDAEGGDSIDGFGFEQVSKGDDE